MDHSLRVLLVEDEFVIRTSLADALETAGYFILESVTAEDAIAELDRGQGVAGLLTDIRLGGQLSGWDVARHARQLQPQLAVVYMSGDSAATWTSEGVSNSIMVPKPFAIDHMVTVVSALLNAIAPAATPPASD